MACRKWLLTAVATTDIPAGDLLIGAAPPDVLPGTEREEPDFLMSFDGGARHKAPLVSLPKDGPRAIGAGAAIWGRISQEGVRPCIAQAIVAVPALESSLEAEAIGLKLGMALAIRTLGNIHKLGIVGDNLPVIRFAACNGRIRTPGIWEILEEALTHAAMQGWRCQWYAVRRCYNKAADSLATIGTIEAVNRAVAGNWRPSITLWEANPRNDNPHLPWHDNRLIRVSDGPIPDPPSHNVPTTPPHHPPPPQLP